MKRVNVPRRYSMTRQARMWYTEGFQDGAKGRAAPDEEFETNLRRHQGDTAWAAYKQGYETGKGV